MGGRTAPDAPPERQRPADRPGRPPPPPKAVRPDQNDASELTRFLNDVLDRTARRHKLAVA